MVYSALPFIDSVSSGHSVCFSQLCSYLLWAKPNLLPGYNIQTLFKDKCANIGAKFLLMMFTSWTADIWKIHFPPHLSTPELSYSSSDSWAFWGILFSCRELDKKVDTTLIFVHSVEGQCHRQEMRSGHSHHDVTIMWWFWSLEFVILVITSLVFCCCILFFCNQKRQAS